MRAKYINKTARRRSIRPDGNEYRTLRRLRPRRRRAGLTVAVVAAAGVMVAGLAYLIFLRP